MCFGEMEALLQFANRISRSLGIHRQGREEWLRPQADEPPYPPHPGPRPPALSSALLGQRQTLEKPLCRTSAFSPSPSTEILATEEEVAQRLLDEKEQAHQSGVELQQLKAELQKAGEKNTHLKASLLYPSLVRRRPGRGLTPGSPAGSSQGPRLEPGGPWAQRGWVSARDPPPVR